ncbi:glycogen debranching enzyme, partial [Streptomyces sp. NPDC005568]
PERADVVWLRPDASVMTDEDWQRGDVHALGVYLCGDAIGERGPEGERLSDDSFLVLFNAWHEPLPFRLPPASFGDMWRTVADTADPAGEESDETEFKAGVRLTVEAHSMLVLGRPYRTPDA